MKLYLRYSPGMTKELAPIELVSPDRLETALATLEELATDTDQSGSVRAGAAKAILSAGVTLASSANKQPRSAGEMTLGDLEAEIAATKKRLNVIDPE